MSTYFRATSTPCSRRASTSSPWGTSIWDRGRPGRVRRTDPAVRGRADPAPRRVVPVETTSATTSATSSCTADSTAPSSRITSAVIPRSRRYPSTRTGYDVATRRPATCSSAATRSADAVEHMQLGFGASTFRFAAPADRVAALEQVAGRRVATSYPVLVDGYLRERGITAEVIRLDGAVESAVQLGVAEVVADVVSTGTTLRGAGLAVFGEPILQSEAVLIRPRSQIEVPQGLEVLARRLQGVLVARQYVLMDYDVPTALVEQAVAITPGLESPTVSPLHNREWSAVRAMVHRDETNQVMDTLYHLGARAILVTSIHACRL